MWSETMIILPPEDVQMNFFLLIFITNPFYPTTMTTSIDNYDNVNIIPGVPVDDFFPDE